jgi:monoamine oxidase
MGQTNAKRIDTAIVGGGCAGLYCAWRLASARADAAPLTYVFEASDRVGGRLLSVDLLPPGGRKAELGGMRFTRDQRLISSLVEHLGEQHSKDNLLGTREYNFGTQLMFLRGHRLRSGQEFWKLQTPYRLSQLAADCKWPEVGLALAARGESTCELR